jgi:hypothetical protein
LLFNAEDPCQYTYFEEFEKQNPAKVIISHAFMVGRLQNQIPTRNILSQQQIGSSTKTTA